MRTLGDLLAIIHGDGGHHTADVGYPQSIDDAAERVCRERSGRSAADNLGELRGMLVLHGKNGNWNSDQYAVGLFNGMEAALALLEGRDPVFRKLPGGS